MKPKSKAYRFGVAMAFIALGVVLFLMLFSFTAHDLADSPEKMSNIFGTLGAHVANVMLQLFGAGAFHFSFVCLVIGICICSGKQYDVKATEIIGLCLLIIGTVPLLALGFAGQTILDHAPGGVFGQWLYALMQPQIPSVAIVLGCAVIVLFGFLLVTDIRLKSFIVGLWRAIAWVFVTLARALVRPFKSEKRPAQTSPSDASHGDNMSPTPAIAATNETYDSGSLYYEDTPSQLLNGVACDLPERVAMAQERDGVDDFSAFDESDTTDAPNRQIYDGNLSEVFDDSPIADQDSLPPDDDSSPNLDVIDATDDQPEAQSPTHDDAPDEASQCIDATTDDATNSKAPVTRIEKTPETLGDIMARIKKTAPKSRSIRRSHSVPALEPEFEFDSILTPEQLQQAKQQSHAAQPDVRESEKVDVTPRTSVLQNWKPRSIDRRTMLAQSATQSLLDNSAGNSDSARDPQTAIVAPPTLPPEPQNVTRDILAQLATSDFDIHSHVTPSPASDPLSQKCASANSAVTRMAVDRPNIENEIAAPQKSANSAVTRMALTPIDIETPSDAVDPYDDTAQATLPPINHRHSIHSIIDELENDNFDDESDIINEIDHIGFNLQNADSRKGDPQHVTFRRNNAFDLVNDDANHADHIDAPKQNHTNMPNDLEQSEQWRALMADANPDFLFNHDKPVVRKPIMRSISQIDKPAVHASDQKTRIPTCVPVDDYISTETPAAIHPCRADVNKQTAQSANPSNQLAFSVAEEKKRPSAQELDNVDNSRREGQTHKDYFLPPLSILHYEQKSEKGFERESLDLYAKKIKEKLEEYKVYGDVINVCPGPVVTRFEYLPAPGTKVAKVEGLSKDLMMALEIMSIRILAPIPGKNVIGIEIPNEHRNTIYFKEVVGSDAFQNAKSLLTIALGKDSEGEPVVSDLAKMPHLLVAGTTGSGKSVGINTMLCSLLYNATPDEVKLILVDPKMLELSIYAGIPHLLVPPITTPHETAAALEWACDEMDERYRKLASFGVRNIAGYNQQLQQPTLPSAIECVKQTDENGDPLYKPMPYIVIVVDEFADLMMVAGKEIEKSIARLAQKARAAGIHIILATQRPSTNIITGVIKANFPTRLAFKVMTLTDSRVILDQRGAETLLGNGDSLFLAPTGALTRVHGAFVSDDEVQAVVAYLAQQREPVYNYDITTPKDEDADESCASMSAFDKDKLDDLFDEAVEVVREAGQASASLLQRRLGIGFNRGARLIEQMERQGIVGPARGQKPREVLM